jgi:hypothetical protein
MEHHTDLSLRGQEVRNIRRQAAAQGRQETINVLTL